ncbi:cytochrome b-c1 complex subunit 8 [Heterostelium album PN500]|uniref:Cytochrome b-c1 complex subunit 8 n=1 Tax=Heterostelium pallidum (strain ATCC 26659 / Pp 5 / PN500) TaxID=670386 RepID=D3B5W4_HETP5|nr:cytochrome b-c1 complex subunit 8 [Heterostelium album PN500]EFA83262.1 cytochrome b-c1 complex subunit 8 [Heterostelium album PN500]|eukprot:XP_020435379.1 cytochrome b-c1 complex subunit 8 [Heterostelium album PN500]
MGGSGAVFGKQITYTLSPFRQRLFVNYFKNAVPHIKRGVREHSLAIVPYFVALGVTVNWANHSYHEDRKGITKQNKNAVLYLLPAC